MGDMSDIQVDNLFTEQANDEAPDFDDLFNEGDSDKTDLDAEARFTKIDKLLGPPQPYFKNPNYYQLLLNGEGEKSKRVHEILGHYLKAKDPQDRSLYRGRLIPAFWDLLGSVAGKTGSNMNQPKRLLLRFGILLPTVITPEQRKLISQLPHKNSTGEPLFYVDEWLEEIAYGRANPSATDETSRPAQNEATRVNSMLEKSRGRFDAQLQMVRNLSNEIQNNERMLQEHIQNIVRHDTLAEFGDLIAPYSDGQKSSFSEMNNNIRRMTTINRQLETAQNELRNLKSQLENLEGKEAEIGTVTSVDTKIVSDEINTIRQMAKLCVGRQGNHFPMLTKQYFHANERDICTRENVINIMADVEYLDPGIFKRTFKQQTNRIVPNTILIASYGDYGVCWEPFERFNRATSRGRIAIPMFPKEVRVAVIAAMGDLRWQVAKEKAQHYWMEEGLTGWYYQWFSDNKMKGDVKDQFIQDYVLWITKESEGTQKMDRDSRSIFWRYMPFPQEVKDNLRNRGFVYNELYKKDQNRSMSDGY